jgi:hemerythrin-like domain-containing protein
MAHVIETLSDEHRNIVRLLDALEHQIEMLHGAAGPDYELLQGIANYFCDYPDRCHHPKEDAVFARLRAKHPGEAAAIGDLAREHRDAAARARRFRDNIHALFRDAVMPLDTIVGSARSFIEAERRHMRMEEERFFPVVAIKFTPDDWRDIENHLKEERDPLFGEQIEEEFRGLRERLLAYERERGSD